MFFVAKSSFTLFFHQSQIQIIIDKMPASDSEEFESGRILVLHGLSKAELNGTLVEVGKKVISETDGSVRWTCFPLKDERDNAPIAIKTANLRPPVEASAADLEQYNDLTSKALKLYRKAGSNNESITKAKEMLNSAVLLVPQSGVAHNILGDIAHFTNQSQETVLKYMRRAVANHFDTPEEEHRVFQARIGYSGALGNLNDFGGEQYQLRKCLDSSVIDEYENARSSLQFILADSYRQEGRHDDAMNSMLELRASKPVLGTFMGQNIDENIVKPLLMISYHFYKIGVEIEKAADLLPEGEEQTTQYELAKLNFHKAIKCAPGDEATKHAWMRIKAKLNPNLNVFDINGLTVVQNIAEGQVVLDTQY